MHKFKTDYHFHPNLPQNKKMAITKARKWCIAYKKEKIDVVLVTEHVYKNPKRAFELINNSKLKGQIFIPGMEYITKEGVEIILFSKSSDIFRHPELKAYNLKYNEVIKLLNESDHIYGFIVHPYAMSKTGIIRTFGYERFKKYLNEIKALEIVSISSLDKLIIFFKKVKKIKISKVQNYIDKKIIRAQRAQFFPETDYNIDDLNFVAVGSDAHDFHEIGNCLELTADSNDFDNIFKKIIDSKDGKIFLKHSENQTKFYTKYKVLKNLTLLFSEYLRKQRFRVGRK